MNSSVLYDYTARSRTNSARFTASTLAVLWAVLLCSLLLLFTPESFLDLSPDAAVRLTLVVLIILSVTGWQRVRKMGENPWISPVSLYIPIVLGLQTTLAFLVYKYSAYLYTTLGLGDYTIYERTKIYFPKACTLILLGAFGVFIGLNISLRFLTKYIPPLNWSIDEKNFPSRAVLVALLSAGSFYLTIRPGIVPLSMQQLLYSAGQIGVVLYIASLIQILANTKYKKLWIYVLIIYIASNVPFILFGSRSAIVFPIIFWVWAYLAVNGKINKKILIGLVSFFFLFASVYPFITLYKSGILKNQGTMTEIFQTAVSSVSADKESILVTIILIMESQVLSGSNVIHYVQQFPDSFPYLKGESFYVVLSELVPRFLYPEKRSAGEYIMRIVYDTGFGHEEYETKSSMFIDAVSEFYINFGLLGVFTLAILQGMYLQTKYDWLVRRSNFKIGFPIYAAAFISPGAFTHLFVLDTKMLAVWIPALWFVSRCTGGLKKV